VTILLRVLSAAFLVTALLGKRWAYIAFMVSSFLYFPAQAGFHIDPHSCELLVPAGLALFSFRNYAHEILFSLFFIVSVIHFSHGAPSRWSVLIRAAIGSLIYGVIIEVGEGLSGHGHCRLRDLLPDSAGIVVGAMAVLVWYAVRRKPA
jgi:hypothetical protein